LAKFPLALDEILSFVVYYKHIVLACDEFRAKTPRSPNIIVWMFRDSERHRMLCKHNDSGGTGFWGEFCSWNMGSKRGNLGALTRQLTS